MEPEDKPTAIQLPDGATVKQRTVALFCVFVITRHSLTYCIQRESIILTEASAVPATTKGLGEGRHFTTSLLTFDADIKLFSLSKAKIARTELYPYQNELFRDASRPTNFPLNGEYLVNVQIYTPPYPKPP
ncbi:hypothetical protein FF38_14344 [Lucilia cuprina]|uniref:Uncharacterized protein n=1 Tax=Lucilia cuprina TaxID=7375 RepID=A0A0L0CFW0_LUCCU|nr:hypothetical protein FF38_14344 [Lucilia cuprina]